MKGDHHYGKHDAKRSVPIAPTPITPTSHYADKYFVRRKRHIWLQKFNIASSIL